MTRFIPIIILFFGIFLMPNTVMACGGGSKEKSCKKEISSTKKEQKSCCDTNSSKNNEDKGCKGNCGHSKCNCSFSCPTTSINSTSEIDFQSSNYSFSLIKKAQFSYTSPSISDGFYSIWLIPKIS